MKILKFLFKSLAVISVILAIFVGYVWFQATDGGQYKLIGDSITVRNDKKINLPELSREDMSRFGVAVSKKSIEEIEELLSSGININSRIDRHQRTPLLMAIDGGYKLGGPEFIKFLLDKGADPELRNEKGDTAIIKAIGLKREKAIDVLLQYDVNLLVGNNVGWTPIGLAAKYGNLDLVTRLLNKKVPVDFTQKNMWGRDGPTPLMHAAESGSVEMVKFLLKNNANTSIKDSYGETALDAAKKRKYIEIANLIENN